MGIEIKSMEYEDFGDNESLELLKKTGGNVFLSSIDSLLNWGRSNSIWPLTFATSCCGIEMMAAGASRHDFARFGIEVYRASPRQADVIVVAGTIVHKMVPVLKRLYDQMPECEIRNCVNSKGFETCANCEKLEDCEITKSLHQFVPEALLNLKSLNKSLSKLINFDF